MVTSYPTFGLNFTLNAENKISHCQLMRLMMKIAPIVAIIYVSDFA